MSEPRKDSSKDDNLLSSLRKIIQKDGGRAKDRAAVPARAGVASASGPSATGTSGAVRIARSGHDDDVLLLTELVDDQDTDAPPARPSVSAVAAAPAGAVPAAAAARAPGPAPASKDAPARPKEPLPSPAPAIVEPSVATPASMTSSSPVAASFVQPLVPVAVAPLSTPAPTTTSQPSTETDEMTSNPISSAMNRLAKAVEEAKPPIAAADPGPTVSSGRSLDEMVKEMMRPILQDWLDKNLPALVERIVDREVQRLTRSS